MIFAAVTDNAQSTIILRVDRRAATKIKPGAAGRENRTLISLQLLIIGY
jgi:hypothetical protein